MKAQWLAISALTAVTAVAGCTAPPAAESTAVSARAATPAPAGPPPVSIRGSVTRVVDGDTVRVRTDDGANLDIRVIGENSPEVVDPRKPVECWGPEASAEAHRVLDGQTVTVRLDPSQGGRQHLDKYGRPLRYISLPNNEDLSVHMVAGGWSRAYKVKGTPPDEWSDLLAAERAAKAGQRGLWGPKCNGGR